MGLLCLYTHFICYLGSGSRAGSIPARYVSPMAELLRLQRGHPVKRKGLAEKGEKRKGERILFHQVVGLQRFHSGSILPLVIGLGLMILAVTGKKDSEKIETTGVKITHSYREDG